MYVLMINNLQFLFLPFPKPVFQRKKITMFMLESLFLFLYTILPSHGNAEMLNVQFFFNVNELR